MPRPTAQQTDLVLQVRRSVPSQLTSCLTAIKIMLLNVAKQSMKGLVKVYFSILTI